MVNGILSLSTDAIHISYFFSETKFNIKLLGNEKKSFESFLSINLIFKSW